MAVERVMPADLQAALERVEALERLTTLNSLHQALSLHQRTTHLRAAQIYAKKEHEAGEIGTGIEALENMNTRTQLTYEIDELNDALLNHKLARFSLQKLAHKIQIQEAVRSSMTQVDLAEPVASFPQKEALITHLTNNAKTCSDLATVIREKQDLDQEILELRLKYNQLVKNIKHKWIATKDTHTHKPAVTEKEKELEIKMNNRESKLLVLVSMIQGLVSNLGIAWGRYRYFRMLLHLCDTVIRNGSRSDQDKCIEKLPKLREDMLKSKENDSDEEDAGETKKETAKLHKLKFFTSTPSSKK